MFAINKYIVLAVVASVLLNGALARTDAEQKVGSPSAGEGITAPIRKMISTIRNAGSSILNHLPIIGGSGSPAVPANVPPTEAAKDSQAEKAVENKPTEEAVESKATEQVAEAEPAQEQEAESKPAEKMAESKPAEEEKAEVATEQPIAEEKAEEKVEAQEEKSQ